MDSLWKVLTGEAPQGDELPPLDRLTPRAQQTLALARLESERLGHHFIGTEHLLLGLIRLGQGVAVNVLTKLGVDLKNLRDEVERQLASGGDRAMDARIPYTPRVKKVLELAYMERRVLNFTYVGTEFILLALIREGDVRARRNEEVGTAARILKGLGLNTENVRQEILIELDPNFAPEPEDSKARIALNWKRDVTLNVDGKTFASSIAIQYLEQETPNKWLCVWSIPFLCNRGAALGSDPIDAFLACVKIIGVFLRKSAEDGWKVTWKDPGDYGGFPDLREPGEKN
jgi:hypothetical protein